MPSTSTPRWPAKSLFVTGTDTGVGKTLVACALVHALRQRGARVLGMKPVASGSELTPEGLRNEDALRLQQAGSEPLAYPEVNPYCFAPAIAPHVAAQQAGTQVDLQVLIEAHARLAARADQVVVEGAGGWRVPLNDRDYFSALPQRTGMAVVLVVGLRLGCINHAVLTAEAIARDGCHLVGWVGNGIEPQFSPLAENLATLHARLPAPCWGVLPFHAEPDARQFSHALNLHSWLARVPAFK